MDLSTKSTKENLSPYLIPKIRNLIHYRLIDTRPRAQYIHVLREIKDEIRESAGDNKMLQEISKVIPRKVKNIDSVFVILEIKRIYESYFPPSKKKRAENKE